jgi:hypothetical protein
MFGSEILEVAIGMSLIYLLMSALCSSIRETAEAWFKRRAVELERGIRALLGELDARGKTATQAAPGSRDLVEALYDHPMVSSLYQGTYGEARKRFLGRTTLPSYIPAANFAAALLDVVAEARASASRLTLQDVRGALANVQGTNPHVERALTTALAGAADVQQVQANLEAWFDSAMDRVAGWYKRRTQAILFGLGLALAIAMNVNTIHLVNYLSRNDAARAALVSRAQAAATDSAIRSARFDTAYARLDSLGLPIGWGKDGVPGLRAPDSIGDAWPAVGMPLLGWLLTGFAITLGAPFWFDVLNKIMVIRATVKPRAEAPCGGFAWARAEPLPWTTRAKTGSWPRPSTSRRPA